MFRFVTCVVSFERVQTVSLILEVRTVFTCNCSNANLRIPLVQNVTESFRVEVLNVEFLIF